MKSKLLYLVGLAILAVLVYFFVDFKELIQTIAGIKYGYLFLIFMLCVPLLGFKAWRWKILMNSQGIRYSLYDSFVMYSVASMFSLFIPGKMGDVAKIFYLKRDQYNLATSFSSIFMDRLFDLLWLVALAIFCIYFFIGLFALQFLVFLFCLTAIFGYLVFFILKDKKKLSRYYFLLNFFIPLKYREAFWSHLDSFFLSFDKYDFGDYFWSAILTVLAFSTYVAQICLLVIALGLKFNYLILIPMIVFSNLADLLPISFNGIGTRESIFIIFFQTVGLSADKAVALGILQLSVVLLTSVIGLWAWFKKPLKIKSLSV